MPVELDNNPGQGSVKIPVLSSDVRVPHHPTRLASRVGWGGLNRNFSSAPQAAVPVLRSWQKLSQVTCRIRARMLRGARLANVAAWGLDVRIAAAARSFRSF